MRREISIELTLRPPGDQLLRLASCVQLLPGSPEMFVWSAVPESHDARLWLIFDVPDHDFENLVAGFKGISGVLTISFHGPGHDRIKTLS